MAKDYDRSIHSNPDALAWAQFFMETLRERLAEKGVTDGIIRLEAFVDEELMVGWFANAMMAMNDHLFQREAFKQELQAAIERERFECVRIARRYVEKCAGGRVTTSAGRSEELRLQAIGASHVGDEIEERGNK